MQQNGTQELAIYGTTGVQLPEEEIIEYQRMSALVEDFRTTSHPGLPIHEQMLLTRFTDAEDREAIANAYFGSEPVPLKKFLGKEVTLLGMIVFEHAPYVDKEGLCHAGYFQIYMLADREDDDGNPVIIKSSSLSIAKHAMNIIGARGWYLFETPQTYRFSVGEKSNAHFMRNVSHDIKRRLKKEKNNG